MSLIRGIIVITLFCSFSLPLHAADQQLFGDWGGLRSSLQQNGFTVEVVLTHDLLLNTRGGIDEDETLLANFDLTVEVDTAAAGWWKNGAFFLYVLGNYHEGGVMTDIVGDLQATSNIETEEALRLYEAWYEHTFDEERLSLLFGMHDYNSEFDLLEYAGLFLNSSFGISPDISQVGPSIFPVAGLAGRVRYHPCEHSYVQAAIYDGVPGDPNNIARTTIRLKSEDGVFAALEAGVSHGEPNQADYFKVALGGWYHTAELETFSGKEIDSNSGIYLLAEKTLYSEDKEGQGLGVFIQLGFADEDKNQLGRYWGAGLHYTGLIPNRDEDVIGLAVACARNSDDFMRYLRKVEFTDIDHTETAIELSYRAALLPWLVVQPDVQYVVNPGTDLELDDALQVGMRVEVIF